MQRIEDARPSRLEYGVDFFAYDALGRIKPIDVVAGLRKIPDRPRRVRERNADAQGIKQLMEQRVFNKPFEISSEAMGKGMDIKSPSVCIPRQAEEQDISVIKKRHFSLKTNKYSMILFCLSIMTNDTFGKVLNA